MKLLSFLLAFCFLSLAVIPCSDKDNCENTPMKTISHVQSTPNQDTQHEDGLCSPLCMCHCCGGVTIIYEQPFDFAVNYPSVKNSIYSESSISEIAYPIWQPPKIS